MLITIDYVFIYFVCLKIKITILIQVFNIFKKTISIRICAFNGITLDARRVTRLLDIVPNSTNKSLNNFFYYFCCT